LYYENADTQKLTILKDNTNKSGIYMWTNLISGKRYIGSSVNLKRRFLEYYNVNRLIASNSMPINRALLRYGFSRFSLKILEYCDISMLMVREKHYFVLLEPEYNLLLEPGSPSKGKGWVLSEETKDKLRRAALNRSPGINARIGASQPTCQVIEIKDVLTNTATVYPSARAAARALGIHKKVVENFIYSVKIDTILGRYICIKKGVPLAIKDNISSNSIKLEVTNIESVSTKIVYSSIGSAARALGLHQASISLYIKEERSKPFKGKYLFKLVVSH